MPVNLLNGLVSHWRLDEPSGTRFDAHGTNHLVDVNSVGVAVGKIGNAAEFLIGQDSFLSAPSAPGLSPGPTQDFTFAVWAYRSSLSSNPFVMGKAGEFDLRAAPSVWELGNGSGPPGAGSGPVDLESWTMIVAWQDSSAGTLNISVNDGAVVAVTNSLSSPTANSFRLGTKGNSEFFDGLIDSVSIWNRVLAADERAALYNGGDGLDYAAFGGGGGRVRLNGSFPGDGLGLLGD